MSNEYNADAEQFINGSLEAIKQGRLQHVQIRYWVGNKMLEVTIRSWDKYEPKEEDD